MSEGRDKYKKLLDKIEQLTGNDPEFRKAMEERFGGSNHKIDEIHELCIERVIEEQAKKFYDEFPIKEIIPQLTKDYKRAEHFKRCDNFEDYCLAIFQQFECITNWFCSNQSFVDNYNNSKEKESCLYVNNRKIILGELIFNDNFDKKKDQALIGLFFNEKVKIVLYYVYFDGKPFNKYSYDTKYNEINELYQCRNLNHRGGVSSDYQGKIIQRIMPHKYLYYLKFSGLLVDFIEKVSQNYSEYS